MKAEHKLMISAFLTFLALMILSGVPARAQEVEAKPELPYGAMESFVEIHSFFNLQYSQNGVQGWDRGDKRDPATGEKGFRPSEFVLFFSNRLAPELYFNAELEQHPGARADEFTMRRMEIHWAIAPGLNLNLGKFYAPVGIERHNHYAPLNRLVSRPLPSLYVMPGTWSEVGVQMYGNFDEYEALKLHYEAAVVNGLGGPTPAGRQDRDNNQELAVAGRIAFTLGGMLTLGASGYQGTYDSADELILLIRGLDLKFQYKGLTVLGEYLDSRIEVWDPVTARKDTAERFGYYVQASYRIPAEKLHLLYLEPAARFDHFEEDNFFTRTAATEIPDLDRFSLGVSVSPLSHFQIKAEYQWLWVAEAPSAPSYRPIDAPDTLSNVVLEAVIDF